jgi:hypothetical protein
MTGLVLAATSLTPDQITEKVSAFDGTPRHLQEDL